MCLIKNCHYGDYFLILSVINRFVVSELKSLCNEFEKGQIGRGWEVRRSVRDQPTRTYAIWVG